MGDVTEGNTPAAVKTNKSWFDGFGFFSYLGLLVLIGCVGYEYNNQFRIECASKALTAGADKDTILAVCYKENFNLKFEANSKDSVKE